MLDKATKYLHKIQIKNKQKAINKRYAKEGLTTELLIEQVKLNKMKHEHNITTSEKLHEEYVQ